ncbi:MAG: polyprenyl synthetase family protein [SAR202 cluster bacterium]|nr:polyprenyl synthetase family protein [SAR202 cluster bacterium]
MVRAAPGTTGKKTVELPQMFSRYGTELTESLRSALSSRHNRVYDTLRYSMGWVDAEGKPTAASSGKALRPTLCLFASEAVGGSVERTMPAAVALEFIHNFSLIHDDIQDKDRTRRGRPTLWVVWGEPRAIVAGDTLRVVADVSVEQLVENGVPVPNALATIEILTEAYLQMIEGQYLDLEFESRHDIGIHDYLDMISRKTGALIRCALEMGALLGTDESGTVAAFRQFGRSLGFVFQIRDDVLGVWGDPEKTGKPVGADIRRKKNSLPVVHALNEASGVDAKLLRDVYSKETLSDGDVASVLDVMERIGTREYAQGLAEAHCVDALRAMDKVEISREMRGDIEHLAEFLLVREH